MDEWMGGTNRLKDNELRRKQSMSSNLKESPRGGSGKGVAKGLLMIITIRSC